ncbi:LacI family DNA-binding transcriptional regulator [Devosia sp. Root635]|uniref:LacI family DNA-binding transcriptional regulator n=1 Tax=Devosia sp. Root635 TaxID=1736575 RepID=UPI0006FAE475|nr:LacI family DNA-binding transcriptional regulator [Devosia sp. Root635]KRA47723.1 LacI family transcriptional regulator [Devosia sp. Root635]
MMDVAAAAGVSQATVSLVLSGGKSGRLADETRRRVVEAAQTLGYKFVRRNQRAAPGGQSTIIFIADETITDPWMSLAFEGARDKALEVGINMLMGVSHADADVETNILAGLGNVSILGLIYGTILTRAVQLPQALTKHRLVTVNCYNEDNAFHSVLPGDVLGGRTATQHLLSRGRKRIGFINGQQGLDNTRDRLKGYKQALSSNDVPFDPALVRPGNWEPSSGYHMTHELMRLDNPPDGIFCANDMMAVGCYDALRELGHKVPDDVAVIGFDDRDIAQYMHPPLSTFVLPLYEMGQIAVELLLDDAGGLHSSPSRIKVECELVERQST